MALLGVVLYTIKDNEESRRAEGASKRGDVDSFVVSSSLSREQMGG